MTPQIDRTAQASNPAAQALVRRLLSDINSAGWRQSVRTIKRTESSQMCHLKGSTKKRTLFSEFVSIDQGIQHHRSHYFPFRCIYVEMETIFPWLNRFTALILQRIQAHLTLFSKYFSSFPHGTCSLSVSGIY